jgi:hypothetical protein
VAPQRPIRDDPPPPDEAILLRALFDTHPHGGVFDRDVLIADVAYNFRCSATTACRCGLSRRPGRWNGCWREDAEGAAGRVSPRSRIA